MTSGRASATASATAREPSSCFSMAHRLVGGGGGGDIRLRKLGRELLANRRAHRFERHDAGDRGKVAEQRRVRYRTADVFQCELGGADGICPVFLHELAEAEGLERARGVEHDRAARREAGEEID